MKPFLRVALAAALAAATLLAQGAGRRKRTVGDAEVSASTVRYPDRYT